MAADFGQSRSHRVKAVTLALMLCALLLPHTASSQDDLVAVIKKVKPGVVAIGSYSIKDKPKTRFFGTGFVVHTGKFVVGNNHVLVLFSFVTQGREPVLGFDNGVFLVHDVTLLASCLWLSR